LSGLSPNNLRLGRGEIETIGAAILFTFQILALEDRRYQENRGLMVTLIMFIGIAALLLPFTLISAPNLATCFYAGASLPSIGVICMLAVLCSVGAYLLMNIWQRKVTATEAGLIYTTEPVFTAMFVLFLPGLLGAWIQGDYPNETLSTQMLAGGSLILSANILMQWKRPPHLPAAGPIS
jgi:drug/metabolite transporter (DMT)-like permease